MSSVAVHQRFKNLMSTWIGLNTTPYIRGLGCAPCITARDNMQAALFPNLLFMTRKDPVLHSPKERDIGCGEPAGFKDKEDSPVVDGVQGIFDIEVQDYRQTFLPFSLVMEYIMYFC